MKFKDNLRKARTRSHFSQEKLAEKLDVSRQTISKWENGDSFPSTKHILVLTQTLHCTYDELVNGKTIIKPNKLIPKKFLLASLIMLGIIFGSISIFRTPSTHHSTNLDTVKLATFDTLAEDFLANTDLLPSDSVKQLVGYGITDTDGTFYVKCDVYSSALPDHRCSAIIYFCEEGGNYSYKCQIVNDPNYHPSGEYHQII